MERKPYATVLCEAPDCGKPESAELGPVAFQTDIGMDAHDSCADRVAEEFEEE